LPATWKRYNICLLFTYHLNLKFTKNIIRLTLIYYVSVQCQGHNGKEAYIRSPKI